PDKNPSKKAQALPMTTTQIEKPHTLTQILKTVDDKVERDKIAFRDIVRVLSHRGFGSLMIAPALIALLPTGAIPGIPAVCGAFILLIALQMAWGSDQPWLPQRLQKVS